MDFEETIEAVGKGVDVIGVAIIIAGALYAFVSFAGRLLGGMDKLDAYRVLRQSLGRSILLGLEVLVAADIIRTVAAAPTLRGVGILGIIVLIRTFLSLSLEVELTGRWPWDRHKEQRAEPGG